MVWEAGGEKRDLETWGKKEESRRKRKEKPVISQYRKGGNGLKQTEEKLTSSRVEQGGKAWTRERTNARETNAKGMLAIYLIGRLDTEGCNQ